MAVKRKAKKKAKKKKTTRRSKRPHLMVVEISTDILKLKPSRREKLCKLVCCSDVDTTKMPMNGYCVIKRWIDGNQWCEQRICYDSMGRVIYRGPILCKPA